MEDILVSAFLKILNMSMTASYIILAVIIARLLLRRAPKKYSYALWLAAAFRLVCPVSFKSVISIFYLKPFNVTIKDSVLTEQGAEIVHIPENIGLMDYPEINTGIEALDPVVNESLPAATPMCSANPMQIWEFFGMLLWVTGMVILLIVSLISLWRLCRRLRTATLLEGNVWQSEAAQSPFIIGLFRTKIYIPYGLEGAPLAYVLAHERAHIRRGDHIVRTLGYLVLCLHWFNPLVWLAFYLMGRDMELSCDEKVLAKLGDRAEYSETLLSFASPRRFPAPTPLAFGESSVGRRIKNALKWRKPRLWVSVIALALCVMAIAACAANPKTEDDGWELAGRWVSVECVYNDGLSSVFPYGDNDRVYDIHAEGDGVRVFDRRSGGFLGGFGIREWQDFPYSDEEWEDMFLAYDMAFSAPLSELYDEILYMGPNPNLDMLPLQSEEEHEAFIEPTDFFMAVDGELRYVSTRKDAQGKLWVSRIDALQKEENIDNTEPADAAAADIPAGSPWELLTGLDFENVSSIMLDGDVAAADREQLNTVALEVLQLLKNVAGNEVYAGRGAPNRCYLSLGFDEGRSGIRLGFCGDFVELQLRGEAKEKYPVSGGAVWEIHNEALTELLSSLIRPVLTSFEASVSQDNPAGITARFDLAEYDKVEVLDYFRCFPDETGASSGSSATGNPLAETWWPDEMLTERGRALAESGGILVTVRKGGGYAQGQLVFEGTATEKDAGGLVRGAEYKVYLEGPFNHALSEDGTEVTLSLDEDWLKPTPAYMLSSLKPSDVTGFELSGQLDGRIINAGIRDREIVEALADLEPGELEIVQSSAFFTEECRAVLQTKAGTIILSYGNGETRFDFEGDYSGFAEIVGTWSTKSEALNGWFEEISMSYEREYDILSGEAGDVKSIYIQKPQWQTDGDMIFLDDEREKQFLELLLSGKKRVELYPSHLVSMQASTAYTITITYENGAGDLIYAGDQSTAFHRYIGTQGPDGDPGYVLVISEEARELVDSWME